MSNIELINIKEIKMETTIKQLKDENVRTDVAQIDKRIAELREFILNDVKGGALENVVGYDVYFKKIIDVWLNKKEAEYIPKNFKSWVGIVAENVTKHGLQETGEFDAEVIFNMQEAAERALTATEIKWAKVILADVNSSKKGVL